jgi:hypothetical protein
VSFGQQINAISQARKTPYFVWPACCPDYIQSYATKGKKILTKEDFENTMIKPPLNQNHLRSS